MKRHAVIGVLKADPGNLDIARFRRVARSFVHKIRKELEKENNVMSVWKHKKHSTRSDSMRTSEFIHKVEKKLMKTKVKQWDQLQKSCMCLKRQSEGVFIKTFDTNLT